MLLGLLGARKMSMRSFNRKKTAEICNTVFFMAERAQAQQVIAFGKRKKGGIPQKVYLFQMISHCFLSQCKCKAPGQKCRKTQVNKSEWMTERVWGDYYRPIKECCSLDEGHQGHQWDYINRVSNLMIALFFCLQIAPFWSGKAPRTERYFHH